MTNTGWKAVGKIARKRRERLGLNQEELALYGGPKVATVGKFERATPGRFPLRTQHQMEKALGWTRGTIEQVVASINEGRLKYDDWDHDLIEEDIPDLSQPMAPVEELQMPAVPLDPFDMRLLTIKAILTLVPEERREVAVQAAVRALFEYAQEGTVEADVADVHHMPESVTSAEFPMHGHNHEGRD